MPLISRSCIENIKERVPIYDLVGQYVSLKRTGSTWKGLSPFNNEKSPSFFVIPDKNIFKCFSSGYAGDIFRFLQLKESLSFQEAIETIAHRFTLTLEYEEDGRPGQNISFKKELFEIHEIVAEIFHLHFLSDTEDGKWIRNYWQKERNFTIELAKEFKIGLAPVDGHILMKLLLKKKNFSLEALRTCGLFFAKENELDQNRFLSRFRGRLMIPIRDVQERVIAFAGRQLTITPQNDPAKDAKYINSPETPIFHKGKTLFGLGRARQYVEKEGFFLLVEGQLDALRCWENGFKTVVAPQGTAVTEQQLETLRRYCSKIYSFLDSDSAGQKASLRILSMALQEGIDINFIPLPQKCDPDTYFINNNSMTLREQLKNAHSPMKFAVNALLSSNKTPSSQEKVAILHQLFEILKKCNSSVIQEEYLLEICHLLNVNRQSIQLDFFEYKKTQKNFSKEAAIVEKNEKSTNEKLTSVEYQLLLIIFNHENIGLSLAHLIDPEWIAVNSLQGKLLLRILTEIREGLWQRTLGIDYILETDQERNMVYSILSEEFIAEEPLKMANICLKKLFINFIDEKKNKIDQQIAKISNQDEAALRVLQQEKINLRKLSQKPPFIVKIS